jgi:hypothetical protein
MSPLGPCVLCGAKDYPLSMGGPTICPACDCGHGLSPNEAATNRRLLSEAAAEIAERKRRKK